MDNDFNQIFIPGALDHTLIKWTLKHIGKSRQDINPHIIIPMVKRHKPLYRIFDEALYQTGYITDNDPVILWLNFSNNILDDGNQDFAFRSVDHQNIISGHR